MRRAALVRRRRSSGRLGRCGSGRLGLDARRSRTLERRLRRRRCRSASFRRLRCRAGRRDGIGGASSASRLLNSSVPCQSHGIHLALHSCTSSVPGRGKLTTMRPTLRTARSYARAASLAVQKRPRKVETPPTEQLASNTAGGRAFALKTTPLKAACTYEVSQRTRPQHRSQRTASPGAALASGDAPAAACTAAIACNVASCSERAALAGSSATHERSRCRVLVVVWSRSGCEETERGTASHSSGVQRSQAPATEKGACEVSSAVPQKARVALARVTQDKSHVSTPRARPPPQPFASSAARA